jgi:hypothetical protein
MKEYFELNICCLQKVVKWSLDIVEKSFIIFNKYYPNDLRVINAIEGAKEFSETGKRTNILRKLAMDAYRSSNEVEVVAASYSANSSSLLASVAFTHPFRDNKQAKHILGPIVYAALSIEAEYNFKAEIEIGNIIQKIDVEIVSLLNEYPPYKSNGKRISDLFAFLDNETRFIK